MHEEYDLMSWKVVGKFYPGSGACGAQSEPAPSQIQTPHGRGGRSCIMALVYRTNRLALEEEELSELARVHKCEVWDALHANKAFLEVELNNMMSHNVHFKLLPPKSQPLKLLVSIRLQCGLHVSYKPPCTCSRKFARICPCVHM